MPTIAPEERAEYSSAKSADEGWKQDPAKLQGTAELRTW
jgi:hypothetical protein